MNYDLFCNNKKLKTKLGEISVNNYAPKVEKDLDRKKELCDAFKAQNDNLEKLRNDCIDKKLSINVTFRLNKNTQDQNNKKIDLDNLLKIPIDVLKEEMDSNTNKPGLKVIRNNHDEKIFEITCHKEFVCSDKDAGIDLIISEWVSD